MSQPILWNYLISSEKDIKDEWVIIRPFPGYKIDIKLNGQIPVKIPIFSKKSIQ